MVKCVKRLPSQWVNHQDSTELGSPARASGRILTEANKLNASLRTETAKWAKDCPRDRDGNIRHFAMPPTGCGVSLFTQSTSFRKQQQQPKQDYAEGLQGGVSLESGSLVTRPSVAVFVALLASLHSFTVNSDLRTVVPLLWILLFHRIQERTLSLSSALYFPPMFFVRSTQQWPETSYGCFWPNDPFQSRLIRQITLCFGCSPSA